MWPSKVLSASPLNPPGETLVIIYRPIDNRWNGIKKIEALIVGTYIPIIETKILKLS